MTRQCVLVANVCITGCCQQFEPHCRLYFFTHEDNNSAAFACSILTLTPRHPFVNIHMRLNVPLDCSYEGCIILNRFRLIRTPVHESNLKRIENKWRNSKRKSLRSSRQDMLLHCTYNLSVNRN